MSMPKELTELQENGPANLFPMPYTTEPIATEGKLSVVGRHKETACYSAALVAGNVVRGHMSQPIPLPVDPCLWRCLPARDDGVMVEGRQDLLELVVR